MRWCKVDVMALTEREARMLQALCTGASNAEIAAALCLSHSSVKNRLTVIYEKLGVRNRTEAVLAITR